MDDEKMTESINEKYKAVAGVIAGAGGPLSRVSDISIQILKKIINEKELDFLMAFKEQRSQTMDQLKESLKKINLTLSEDEINQKANTLAKCGAMFNQPNSKGVMVYRVMPFWNVGIYEYTFMGGPPSTPENKELAALFTKMSKENDDFIQSNYDAIVSNMDRMIAPDRTVPIRLNKDGGNINIIKIDEKIEVPQEWIIPAQEVEKIIEKFDKIAVGHCFCRYHEYLDGNPCEQVDPQIENCFSFGKSANHVSQNGFGRLISKEEAHKILRQSEEFGLIHKAYHPRSNITRPETSICSCCSDCCGNSATKAVHPVINASMYITAVNKEKCTGCGTCVEKCPTEATFLNDDNKAERKEELCIGCGVCAYFCPDEAISLVEKPRIVRIPPHRRK